MVFIVHFTYGFVESSIFKTVFFKSYSSGLLRICQFDIGKVTTFSSTSDRFGHCASSFGKPFSIHIPRVNGLK